MYRIWWKRGAERTPDSFGRWPSGASRYYGGGFFSRVDLSFLVVYFEWHVYLYWYIIPNFGRDITLGIYTFRRGVPYFKKKEKGKKLLGLRFVYNAPHLKIALSLGLGLVWPLDCACLDNVLFSLYYHALFKLSWSSPAPSKVGLSDVSLTMTCDATTLYRTRVTASWDIKPETYNIIHIQMYL